MANSTVENNLLHVMTWTLQHLESLCKEIGTEGEALWPTLEQLVTSGQLGRDILNVLASLKPVIGYAEKAFPQYAPMINWADTILTDLASFTVVNTPCTCSGCNPS
jgi:hypothetical protein